MSSHGKKHSRDIVKELERLGVRSITVEYTGKHHVRLIWPGGTFVYYASPGDPRGFRNARAALRRIVRNGNNGNNDNDNKPVAHNGNHKPIVRRRGARSWLQT
jgi:hypothetical protein